MVIRGILSKDKKENTVIKRKLTKKTIEKLVCKLNKIDWFEKLNETSAEDSMNIFHDALLNKLDQVAPEKIVRVSNNRNIKESWMTRGLLKCSDRQLKLYRNYLAKRDDQSKELYKNYRKVFQQIKRNCRRKFFWISVLSLKAIVRSYGI